MRFTTGIMARPHAAAPPAGRTATSLLDGYSNGFAIVGNTVRIKDSVTAGNNFNGNVADSPIIDAGTAGEPLIAWDSTDQEYDLVFSSTTRLRIPWASLPSFANGMTIYYKAKFASVSGSNEPIVYWETTGAGQYSGVGHNMGGYGSGYAGLLVVGSGGSTSALLAQASAIVANTFHKYRAVLKTNDFAMTVNGGSVLTDTAGAQSAYGTHLDFGWLNFLGIYSTGRIREIVIVPDRAVTNANLVTWMN